jgi:hypothetical protein
VAQERLQQAVVMTGLMEEPLLVEQERRGGLGQGLPRPWGVECRRCRNVRWELLRRPPQLQVAAGRSLATAARTTTQQSLAQQVVWPKEPERLCGALRKPQQEIPGVGQWSKAHAPV